MKAYLVSLDRSIDRREQSLPAAHDAGLDIEVWRATDGSSPDYKKDSRILGGKFNDGWLQTAPGSQGCAVSHVRLLEHIVASGAKDPVAIIEDDFAVSKDFVEIWRTAASELPAAWGIAHMASWDQKNMRKNPRHSDHWVEYRGIGCTGTYCYVVNPINILKWLAGTLPLLEEIDHHWSRRWYDIVVFQQVLKNAGDFISNSRSIRNDMDGDAWHRAQRAKS